MDTTMVEVNGRCNLGCAFCELKDRPALDGPRLEALVEQLRGDREAGAHRLRIGGGEPTLEANLPALVSAARDLGYETIILETNGTVASLAKVAPDLANAGVTDVLWALPSADPGRMDALTGLPGSHAAALAGARALAGAGVRIIARTPLSTTALAELTEIAEWLHAEVPGLCGWWLRPLKRSPRSNFDVGHMPSLEDMSQGIVAAAKKARTLGLPLEIDDELGLPLCLLREASDALAGLRRHPHRDRRDSHFKSDPCSGCAASSDCPGQPKSYDALHGPWEVTPFRRAPRALIARKSRPEQQVIYDHTVEQGDTLMGPQVTIRVVMPCNQDCSFCFVDRTSPSLSDAAIEAAIDAAAEAGASRISLSGGEPTLHRRLAQFVGRAKDAGVAEVELQTNALLLGDAGRCDEIVSAGLNQAVVSLHAVDPTRYLKITGAGTPTEVIAGVRNLLDRGVRVELNVVQNADNLDHLADIVAVVAAQIPEVEVLFSVTFIVDGLPRAWGEVAVRYVDAVPHLADAMQAAREGGVTYRLTGRCGTPPCSWRGRLEELERFGLLEIAEEPEASHTYVSTCQGCAARAHCYGINTSYLRQFGEDEFRALTLDEWQVRLSSELPA
jgi:molybdenum cofactor biosynthesis enzyme MoaA